LLLQSASLTHPQSEFLGRASVLFTSPKQATAIAAKLTPNLFSACRRVTDWANPLASSSNLLLITFPFVLFVF
jgi:hypothetical protein